MTTSKPTYVSLPTVLAENFDKVFCISAKGTITRRRLFAHALAISKELPDKAYAINLCQNRYFFIVAYLAVIIRNQVSLLPSNQSPRTIKGLLSSYSQSYCILDKLDTAAHAHGITSPPESLQLNEDEFFLMPADISFSNDDDYPIVNIDRTISISFTSGSTGHPKAVEKNWREFQSGAELAIAHFNLAGKTNTLVSTVPAQHMYGLETSLFWPLFSSLSIHDSRPFYPEDIASRLKSLSQPGILISTPAHLKACTKTKNTWPLINKILSSTAPMSPALAQHVEATFHAPLHELFGSTETLSFASRRVAEKPEWQSYIGIQLWEQNNGFVVGGGHLPQPVNLDDKFLLRDDIHSVFWDGRMI